MDKKFGICGKESSVHTTKENRGKKTVSVKNWVQYLNNCRSQRKKVKKIGHPVSPKWCICRNMFIWTSLLEICQRFLTFV